MRDKYETFLEDFLEVNGFASTGVGRHLTSRWGGITVECKVRAKQSGLGTIYQWLDQAPGGLLVAKLDRKRAIAITYLGDLLRVSKALAGGQTTDEAKLIVDAIDAWENQ